MKRLMAVGLMVGLVGGCLGADDGEKSTITKEQARASAGKDDNGADWCEVLDWYGDGECDDFCPNADVDCADENNGGTNNGGTNNGGTNNGKANNGGTNNGGANNRDGRCGGIVGATCPEGDFCDYSADAQCGIADQLGTCAPRPEVCTEEYDPVCGCDGQTYGNACSANSAGVSVAASGECGKTACASDADCADGEVCSDGVCEAGGSGQCGSFQGTQCADTQWCDYPDGSLCGANDAPGTCEPRPEFCNDLYDPVCGCDGVTYSNACEANSAGVDAIGGGRCAGSCATDQDCGMNEVCQDGACVSENGGGGICGGIIGAQCNVDEWCDYPEEAVCGASDFQGQCRPRPDACTLQYDPVCGCDGATYSNGCHANKAGVDVYASGPCTF